MTFVLSQGFTRSLDDGRGACISFQAAQASTATLSGVRHFNFDVAQLGAVAVLPLHDDAADDDASTYACAEGIEHQTVQVFARANPVLTHGGGIGIILKRGRNFEAFFNWLPDCHVLPGPKVGWV